MVYFCVCGVEFIYSVDRFDVGVVDEVVDFFWDVWVFFEDCAVEWGWVCHWLEYFVDCEMECWFFLEEDFG